MTVLTFNPDTAAYRENPYPILADLRARDPVHWSPALKGWVLTRHSDVQRVLKAEAMSADKITPFYAALPSETKAKVETLMRYLGTWLPFRDPPDHTRLRMLIARAFTPKALASIKPNIESVTTLLLDRMHGRDEVDLVAEFANPLPAYVIMDMLGVPRAMLPEMKSWSDDIRLFIGTARGVPDKYGRVRRGTEAMAAAFRTLVEERRVAPRGDILSTLVAAHEADAGRLSDDDLIATSILFLFAGHETTTSLIAMASKALMDEPDLRQQFSQLQTPGVQTAVEEFLRHDGPTPVMMRIALRDDEIGGKAIKKGDRVWTMIGAANRDPSEFENPDAIMLTRAPNRHVTFGYGPHFCLGAPLARLEAQIALPALHKRYPKMTRVAGDIAWADGLGLRGPEHLPVRLGAAA
jgi:cytochrome P450